MYHHWHVLVLGECAYVCKPMCMCVHVFVCLGVYTCVHVCVDYWQCSSVEEMKWLFLIKFIRFQLKDNCFTVLHWFLPNTNKNQRNGFFSIYISGCAKS